MLVATALELVYFFVLEATWGQTIGKALLGLRVMQLDGSPARPSSVAARTILRVVEDNLIGLLVMVLTGKRRQRIGDLLGKTMVGRVAECPIPTPLTPWHAVYPVSWLALAGAVAFVVPPGDDAWVADMDTICESRVAAEDRMPQPLDARVVLENSIRETDLMSRVEPPEDRATLHADLVASKRRFERFLARAIDGGPRRAEFDLQARREAAGHNTTFARLGMDFCAR